MIVLNTRRKILLGDLFTNSDGKLFRIIDNRDSKRIKVRFVSSGLTRMARSSSILRGSVPEKEKPRNHGTLGVGEYSMSSHPEIYKSWDSMIQRVHSRNKNSRVHKVYRDVSICPEWYDFQNFARWAEVHYKEGYELDKDSVVEGNTLYCPEYCRYLPRALNRALTRKFFKPEYDSPPNNLGVYCIELMINGQRRTAGSTSYQEAKRLYCNLKLEQIDSLLQKFHYVDEDVIARLLRFRDEVKNYK